MIQQHGARTLVTVTVTCVLALACKSESLKSLDKSATESTSIAEAGNEAKTSAAMRIVSVGATTSEVLVALGLGQSIVAIDRTSMNVEGAKGKPMVGYYSKLSAEGILAQNPTHVLGMTNAGPSAVIKQLEDTGITVSLFETPEKLEGTKAFIKSLGAATGKVKEAQATVDYLSADIAVLEQTTAKIEKRPKAMFLYARGTRTLMVAGRKSAAHEMLRLAGADNALGNIEAGFVPLTAEAAIKAAPDVIVVPTKGAESVGGIDGVIGLPGIAQTPAGQNRRIVTMNDLELLSFGPECGKAALKLSKLLMAGDAK